LVSCFWLHVPDFKFEASLYISNKLAAFWNTVIDSVLHYPL
jgi:hypothetical protein